VAITPASGRRATGGRRDPGPRGPRFERGLAPRFLGLELGHELVGGGAEAIEGLAQVRDLVVRVDALRRLRRSVAEDVLYFGQLGAPVQHDARLGMAERVRRRADAGDARIALHDGPDRLRAEAVADAARPGATAATVVAQEQGRVAVIPRGEVLAHGGERLLTEEDHALLLALAGDERLAAVAVRQIVAIEARDFLAPHAAAVEHVEERAIAQGSEPQRGSIRAVARVLVCAHYDDGESSVDARRAVAAAAEQLRQAFA